MTIDTKADLIKKLISIAPHVTAKDRKEAIEKFSTNKADLSQLLHGYVTNVDKGLEVLEFFHVKVIERQKRLEAVKFNAA